MDTWIKTIDRPVSPKAIHVHFTENFFDERVEQVCSMKKCTNDSVKFSRKHLSRRFFLNEVASAGLQLYLKETPE